MSGYEAEEVVKRAEIISKFRVNDKDCGSPEVQVALITRRLETLSQHFKTNPKDYHSQRGMFRLIALRKRLLAYMKEKDVVRYKNTIEALGLRK